jgi:DNA-binding MarR family transcriptional regulator
MSTSANGADDLAEWPTGRLLSMAARLVEGAWSVRLAEQGLTHAGLMALHELGHDRPLSLHDLAARCKVTPQTMTRTVDRLERDGLVERRRAQGDRRSVEVALTATGRQAYLEAVDMSAAEPDLLGDVVDLPQLRANLVSIVAHLNPGAGRTLP